MKKCITGIYLLIVTVCNSQNKVKYPVWSFHDDSTTICGISAGLNMNGAKEVTVHGVNLEVLGLGGISFMLPRVPNALDSMEYAKAMGLPAQVQVNGVNVSPFGTLFSCDVNGINAGFVGTYISKMNGLSITAMQGFSDRVNGVQVVGCINVVSQLNGAQLCIYFNVSNIESNGLQLAAANFAKRHNGVQIGAFNKAADLRGFQFGIWNVNGRRKLPLVNWQFKAKKVERTFWFDKEA